LTTKCIKDIRDLFEYALYKFTLYLLTYLLQVRLATHLSCYGIFSDSVITNILLILTKKKF